MKKSIALSIMALVCLAGIFAGGKSETPASQKVVTTVCRASYANEAWYNQMNADFEAQTGIRVNVMPTPGNDDDHDAKVNIDLLAGGTIDVIPSLGPKYYFDRVDAGYFQPLSALVRQAGVDASAIWGSYLPTDESGEYYSLPTKQEVYCVFYNKALFDAAGVAYPSGAWTWDEYYETARKISDPSKGIYGSFMNLENPWTILPAKQRNVDLYNEQGLSNYSDPAFVQAIQQYKAYGDEGVQMPASEILNENVSWNYYAIGGDKLGMFPQGNWFTRLLNSQADYPRDWKYGVTQLPSAGADGNNNLVSMGYVSVNKHAAHPQEALEYVLWLGQNQWKYEGGIPALASLTQAEQEQVFSTIAANSNGQVTVAELYNAMMNTGMGVAQSDIIGIAANEYNRIANAEVQAYCLGLQSLEQTVSKITARVDEAIKNVR